MTERLERGACFCGGIVAQFCGEPFWICYDHDTDCRRASGAAVMVWVGYRPQQFEIIAGEPAIFSKTSGVFRGFCARCGSAISYRDAGMPTELYFAVGFFDHPERFPPQAHAYWRERLAWLSAADQLPCIDTYSRARDPAFGNPKDRD